MSGLTERITVHHIRAFPDGRIEVERVYQIMRGEDVVSTMVNEKAQLLMPGDDLTGIEAPVVALAHALWAPEAIADGVARLTADIAARHAKMNADAALVEAKIATRREGHKGAHAELDKEDERIKQRTEVVKRDQEALASARNDIAKEMKRQAALRSQTP